jgi:glycosyltransferase involved in cell wall biosynthesis
MPPLSAVVITHNEEQKIGACLDSLFKITSDVVVVDSGSTDRTREICLAKGARCFTRSWDGYPSQKNFGNAQAQYDWIVSIDADERLSDELVASIRQAFGQEPAGEAFRLKFATYFCGQWIRYGGWNPEWHVRIFDRRQIEWNRDAVHEGLTLAPGHRVAQLQGLVQHYTVDTLAAFYAKTVLYSDLFADKGRRSGKKASWFKLIFSPIFRFLAEYFFRLGFLDGRAGYLIARENARYTFLKYWKLRGPLPGQKAGPK